MKTRFNAQVIAIHRLLFCTAVAISMVMFSTNVSADDSLDPAAVWLMGQQINSGGATDGAFPFTPGGSATTNTQGATALGLVRAFQQTMNPLYLNSATDNGDFIVNGLGGLPNSTFGDGDPRFSTHDLMFLEELAAVSGNSIYSNYAQTFFWDKLTSSTYGQSNNLDADGFGSLIVTNRTNQGNVELSPWDLSKTAIAAHLSGETTARDAFMDDILNGLELTTLVDNTFDLHGLAGAIWASSVTGIDLDPTAGRYAGLNSTSDLVGELLNWQAPNGGFVFNTTFDPNDPSGAGTQVTAFALLALNDLDPNLYASQISSALSYLRSIQNGSGQYLSYPGAPANFTGSVETHGEAMEAYASAIPEPSSMIMLGAFAFGGLMLRRRR